MLGAVKAFQCELAGILSCSAQSPSDTQAAVYVKNVSGKKRIASTCEHLLTKMHFTMNHTIEEGKTSVTANADVIIKPKCGEGMEWKWGRGHDSGEN